MFIFLVPGYISNVTYDDDEEEVVDNPADDSDDEKTEVQEEPITRTVNKNKVYSKYDIQHL